MPGHIYRGQHGDITSMSSRIDEHVDYLAAARGAPKGGPADHLFVQDDDGLLLPTSNNRFQAPMSEPPGLSMNKLSGGIQLLAYHHTVAGRAGLLTDDSEKSCDAAHVNDCTFDAADVLRASKGAPLFDIASSCLPGDLDAGGGPSTTRFCIDDDGAIVYDMRIAEQEVFAQMMEKFGL